MKQKTLILVVEDEPGIAELLRYTLEAGGFSVHISSTSQEAREALAQMTPSVVLLDWMLPDLPGIALLRNWRASADTATLPVIMLTAKGLDEDKVSGLNAGADDYITKPFSPRELLSRVNAVLRRHTRTEPIRQLSVGTIIVDEKRHTVHIEGKEIDLGPAEFKLLRFLMTYPERIFSRAQLLDKVWGDHAVFEERTVDVHIMRLRKSLGAAGDCIKTVRSVGYTISAQK